MHFLQLALQKGFISRDQLEKIQQISRDSQQNIIQTLLQNGYLQPSQVSQILKSVSMIMSIQSRDVENKTTEKDSFYERKTESLGNNDPKRSTSQAEKIFDQIDFVPGDTWRGFDIFSEIGRGGMGVVYKAKQKGIKREIALKVLSTKGEYEFKRFLREAKANATLAHPNIVPIFSMGQEKDYPYLVMKYIEGSNFSSLLRREKLTLEERLEIIAKISNALHYAHQKNIIHRDIKPSNILVDLKGEPYLSDFGLAKFLDSDSQLTNTGSTLGTPFFMSPEQVKADKKHIGSHSDVYGMGVILYQALTGKLPFEGETPSELYYKILNQDPIPPRKHKKEISKELQAICLTAMAKNITERYQTASDLAEDIQNYLEGKKVHATRFHLKIFLSRSFRRIKSIPWWAFAACSVIIFSLILFFVYQHISSKKERNWLGSWRKAQSAFQEKNYTLSLKHLRQIKSHPNPEKLKKFEGKILQELSRLVKVYFDEGKYEKSLQYLRHITNPGKNLVKIRAKILVKTSKLEDLPLVLAHLGELSPTPEELNFMANLALQCSFFRDAQRYYEFLWKHPESSFLQKRDSLLKLCYISLSLRRNFGTYLKALQEKFPNGENFSDVLLLNALQCFHQRKFSSSLRYCKRIEKSTSFVSCRKFFLEALLVWEKQLPYLFRWRWLSATSGKKFPRLIQKLAFVKARLQEARKDFLRCPKDFLNNTLGKQLDLFFHLIRMESSYFSKEEALAEYKKFQISKSSLRFRQNQEIFIYESLIRFLIRHKCWEESNRICNRLIRKYPWSAYFYLLRTMIKFQRNDFEGIDLDNSKFMRLKQWDFIVMDNVSDMFLSQMTQEEFYRYFYFFLNWALNSVFDVPQTLFSSYFEEMVNKTRLHRKDSREVSSKRWPSLLKTIVDNSSSASRNLALSLLALSYKNKELQKEVERLSKKHPEAIKLLKKRMKGNKFKDQLKDVRNILLRYGVFYKPNYILQLRKMENSSELLKKILLDPEQKELPMMKFLAACMLVGFKSKESFDYLSKLASTTSYPANLVACIVLRRSKYYAKLPHLSHEKFAGSDKFYRLLLALYLDPYEDKSVYTKFAKKLLFGKEEIVSLAAAYNLRRYTHHHRSPYIYKAEEVLVKLCKSQDENIHALALRVLWRLRDRAIDSASDEEAKDFQRESLCTRYWKNEQYVSALMNALKLDSPEIVQLAALQNIVGDRQIRKHINSCIENNKKKLVRKLFSRVYKLYKKSNSLPVQYWTSNALAILDTKKKIKGILQNSHVDSTIRSGIVSGILGREDPMQILSLLELGVKKPKTQSDRKIAQIFLFISGWLPGLVRGGNDRRSKMLYTILNTNAKSNLIPALSSTKLEIRRAAVSALVWSEDVSLIPKIKKLLNHKDKNMQRAAACTLSALSFQAFPDKWHQKYFKKILKKSFAMRRAASLGYYDFLLNKVMNYRKDVFRLVPENSNYGLFHRNLKIIAKESTPKKLRLLLRSLRYAHITFPTVANCYESAFLYYHLKDYDNAQLYVQKSFQMIEQRIRRFDDASDIMHFKPLCFWLQARIFLARKLYKKSENCLLQAIQEFPFEKDLHLLLVKIYTSTKRGKLVEKHLWKAYFSKQNPKFSFRLASLYIDQGQILKALELGNYSSISWKRSKSDLRKKKVKMLLRVKLYSVEQNIHTLKKYVELYPDDYFFHFHLANMMAKQNQKEACHQYVYSYLCLPRLHTLLLLASYYTCSQDYDRAIQTLQFGAKKFGLTRKDMRKIKGLSVLHKHPWVRSLPRW